MNHLIRFIACLFLITLFYVSPATAHRGPRVPNPEQIISTLTDRLNLTDEQVSQVHPIIEEQVAKQREIFERGRVERHQQKESLRSELEAIRNDTESQLETILTTEQMEAYREFQNERRQGMENCRFRRFK